MIDHQTHQGRLKREDKKSMGEHLMNSPLGGSLTHDLGYSLGYPLTIHPIFHVYLLWPIQENTQYGKFSQRPSPKIIAGEEEWEVEDIIDSRNKNGVKEFLVHWKGYPETERTWEPETNITNSYM